MNGEPLDKSIKQILLEKGGPNFEYAWIQNTQERGPHPLSRVYWAGFPKNIWAPSSAALKLIQGIFERYHDQSFFLLRQKIFTTAAVSHLEKGMVRLAAKKIQTGQSPHEIPTDDFECVSDHQDLVFQTQMKEDLLRSPEDLFLSEEKIEKYLRQLIATIERGKILHDFNRPVSAVLLGSDGQVLAQSVHGGSLNKTLHAEVRLCQSYFKKMKSGFPEKSRLVVSLKPCLMCAAMISRMSEKTKNFQVFYLEDDSGPLSQNTLLDEKKNIFKYGSGPIQRID